MQRFLILSTFFAVTAISANAAMANDNRVALSVGVPAQVYVNVQSTHHGQMSSAAVPHEQMRQRTPVYVQERHVQYSAPAHVQSSYQSADYHGRRSQRHEYAEERRHDR